MGVISPHDSARCMCIMWVNLIQIFPFLDRLLTQQQLKVTHVEFGTESWALHKSQVGEVLWVQVTVSIRRVWARSLKRATLRITSRGRSRSMHLLDRKGVWRMCDQGPPGREGTPSMVSGAFAVALSWMFIRIRCPIILPLITASPWGPQQNDQDQWAHTSAAFPWTSRIVWDHS